MCNAYGQGCSGFTYNCIKCNFDLNVECSLKLDIFTHEGHKDRLILSNTAHRQKRNCCDNKGYQVFRCTIYEFELDFQYTTLPHTTNNGQHEHPFTLRYRAEDDFSEYYCDIYEEERDSKVLVLLLWGLQLCCSSKLYYWEIPKLQVWRCLHIWLSLTPSYFRWGN